MQVRLFLSATIEDFVRDHANAKVHFRNFITVLRYADWHRPADIPRSIRANLLGNGSDRVVFDIGGNGRNAFRLICSYKFGCPYRKSNTEKVQLYVNRIGTHEVYNMLSEEQKRTITDY